MRARLAITVALVGSLLAGCGLGAAPFDPTGAATSTAAGTKGPKQGASDWVVFVYMGADNNLAPYASQDLNEMEAGLDSSRVKFVVLVDQQRQGDSRIVEVTRDPEGFNQTIVSPSVDDGGAVIPADHEVDTGSPDTLERFARWGAAHYPARRSMMVIWNHGGGAFAEPDDLKSFCWDDQSSHHLNLVDLWRVAQRLSDKMKYDIVGFDTCLLGHIETAYQLRDLTSFLVSSEKTIPGEGWDYQALARTLSSQPGIYPRELSAAIVRGYHDYYQQKNATATLSSIDLQKLKDRTVPALNQLSERLISELATPGFKASLNALLLKARKLSTAGAGEEDALDVGLLTGMIAQAPEMPAPIRALAEKARQEMARATVANMITKAPADAYTGMKIYFDVNFYIPAYQDPSHQFFGTTGWGRFIQAFYGK